MTPQISIVGIVLVLPFYWLAFLGLRRLWRKTEGSPRRGALLLLAPVLLVFPFADELWIAWHFERACKEAGVTVYRMVEAEGYVDATNVAQRDEDFGGPRLYYSDPDSLVQFDKRGYLYRENLYSDGSVMHVERHPDGVYVSTLRQPQSRYHYRRAHKETWAPAGFQMGRNEMQVVDSQTGEVLGRELWFSRWPSFIEGLWIRFLGSGQIICYGESEMRKTLYEAILIPKKVN
ncbi:hypothetical protein [Sulfurisoma sediminicola]|uniref:Uncharacterized protein n=1 Tax=Sulfurisoma sediminicola TaxID=1381557 RepID=A0A497X7E2_9PROT|nr:hypothetical protein [Sulfurisoma sediminicola]RLJ61236.1 hypothetical protein DFR35_2915 [Sulfurisoma sediminicola]